MKSTFLILAAAIIFVLPAGALAWDYAYDGSVLPNDASLAANRWAFGGSAADLSMCSADGNVLQVGDMQARAVADFSRGASLGPVTMEARVRVIGEPAQYAFMGVGTNFSTYVELHPGYLETYFDYGNPPVTYSTDTTAFHALRIAINAQGQSYVWLDQTLVAQGLTNVGGQGGVFFGGSSEGGLGQSQWDYVAYSTAFLPAPEPSSLLGLGLGLIPLGLRFARKRR